MSRSLPLASLGVGTTHRRGSHAYLLLASLALAACRGTMSPLSNRLKIGEESFVIFVARGEGDLGDLYALPASGGVPLQVTFTRVEESAPAITGDGSVLAFIRASQRSETPPTVVFMNLLNGAERRVELPSGAIPVRLGWSADQTKLYIRAAVMEWSWQEFVVPAPPQSGFVTRVATDEKPAADSALSVVLGTPAFALAGSCLSAPGICAQSDSGESMIDSAGKDPARWGPDTVAFVARGEIQLLPLGGGHLRDVRPSHPLIDLRQPTYAAGPGPR